MIKDIVLRVEFQGSEPFEHRVSGDELVIGRASSSGLAIPDPNLLPRQARLYLAAEGWYLEDLGGRRSTLLNGLPVSQPTLLSSGDLIKMSDTQLRVAPTREVRWIDETLTGAPADTVYRPVADVIGRSELFDPAHAAEASLRRQSSRLHLINEVHRVLAYPITLDELLKLIMDRVFAELIPDEAVIFLQDARGEFYRAATRRVPGVSVDFFYSRSLVKEVTEKKLAALVFDTSRDARFATASSIVTSGVRSLLAAPLVEPDGCPGLIVLSSRANIRQFSEDDMELLVSLAAVAALRIRNIALAEDAARRRSLEKELELARAIQVGLLPEALPQIAGYEVRASNAPSRTVSGDLYKVQMRNEGREYILLMADVSGKGMAAALLMASLEALAVGPIEVGLPADAICNRLSRRLHARTSVERYATAFVAVLETERHVISYANAGHNPPLLMRADGSCTQLGATGIPLGLLPSLDYSAEELPLAPGDTLFIYTDGIPEATNPEGEEYGRERLEQTLRRHMDGSLDDLLEGLEHDVDAFVNGVPYGDDRTILVLRRTGLAPSSPSGHSLIG